MSGERDFASLSLQAPLSAKKKKKNKNHIENYASHYRYYLSIINP
jgi:hypothetical protein